MIGSVENKSAKSYARKFKEISPDSGIKDLPCTEPFYAFTEKDRPGTLLIHGFTGSPSEMRLFAQYLAQKQYNIVGPTLPGHASQPSDLNKVVWQDWLEEAQKALDLLSEHSKKVFVIGLSLGGLVALKLACENSKVAGLILLAPAVKVRDWRFPLTAVGRHFIKFFPKNKIEEAKDFLDSESSPALYSYDTVPVVGASEVYKLQKIVRKNLNQVTQDIIVFQSPSDAKVPPRSVRYLLSKVGSASKEVCWLKNSGHNVPMDSDRNEVFAVSHEWLTARCST